MEVVISPYLLWNLVMTVVIVPLGFLIRTVLSEQKRLDILVNKTREQIEADFERVLSSIQKIDEKLDRLQAKTYFQE